MRSSPSTHTRADIIWRGMESEIEVETGIELLESQLAGNLRAIFQISQAGDDACSLMILITLALFMEPWKLVLQVCNYKTLTTRSLPANLSNGIAARPKTWQFAHFQGLQTIGVHTQRNPIPNPAIPEPRSWPRSRMRSASTSKSWWVSNCELRGRWWEKGAQHERRTLGAE